MNQDHPDRSAELMAIRSQQAPPPWSSYAGGWAEEAEPEIDVMEYVRLIWAKKWLVLARTGRDRRLRHLVGPDPAEDVPRLDQDHHPAAAAALEQPVRSRHELVADGPHHRRPGGGPQDAVPRRAGGQTARPRKPPDLCRWRCGRRPARRAQRQTDRGDLRRRGLPHRPRAARPRRVAQHLHR